MNMEKIRWKELLRSFGIGLNKLFNGNQLNLTISNRISKKRASLVEEMLKGFQNN